MEKRSGSAKIIRSLRKARNLLKNIVVIILFNLSKLSVRSPKIIVFGGECGRYFGGNPKYLFIESNKNPHVRNIWITKSKPVVNQVRELGFQCFYYRSLRGMYYQLRAQTCIHSHSITDDFNRVLLGNATVINTWHGVGLKTVWFKRESSLSYRLLHDRRPFLKYYSKALLYTTIAKPDRHYVIATSPRVAEYYPETFSVRKENVLELGQARNDRFFNDALESNRLPDWMKHQRIITYMPTHRNFGKDEVDVEKVFDLETLDRFCFEHDCMFVIKFHMHCKISMGRKFNNIIDISQEGYDTQEILKYTDVLITDYSSCYTDYLLLDRPVLFYCYDYTHYVTHLRDMYFPYHDVTPGPKVAAFDELMEELKAALSGEDGYREERRRVLDIFYSPENRQSVSEKQMKYIYHNIINRKRQLQTLKENAP